jgi:hypothetical protein
VGACGGGGVGGGGGGGKPFSLRIDLIPVIDVSQFVVRIVLEPEGSDRTPLCVFLGDSLLRNTAQPQLLVLAQLCNDGTLSIRVRDYRRSQLRSLRNHQVPRVHRHRRVRRAARVQHQRHRAPLAVQVAHAVARVHHLVVDVGAVERDQAQSVREELVGYYGRVDFDLDQVDCCAGVASTHHPH